ncbi:hypothetical protein BV22DRAFT_1027423 [Leucogyrophana mollusca]|uniref:Uncharacterized protein n=1 Tax=Leucogyrophana mollusca TaxID=85980 RepID=A0ACB8C1N0_9AGAM|nr:hypothetical protein BV22DRAFT_1027423 [Leucogyrophana mollusca]
MSEASKDTISQVGAAFREDGRVGSAFNTDGILGGTAQKVGGPFDKEGIIGNQFTTDGALGGTAQVAGEKISGMAASAKADPQSGAADRSSRPADR